MRFHNPTRIHFGAGILDQVDRILSTEMGAKRPFLVTDKGIKAAGIAGRLMDAVDLPVFDSVEANPKDTTVNRGGEIVRNHDADMIVALGGGSVIDAAKAIALLATNHGEIRDYEGREQYRNPPLPLCAVPTTCGTGSEVTWVSVITDTERRFKMSIKGPAMFPAVALVDPDLLQSLPPSIVASTGLDALTHAVEAYTVKPATFITDVFAREALKLIFSSLVKAYKDISGNEVARTGMMKGSLFAGLAFGNSDVGAVHCIAEAVGSMYDTPHGIANSIFLPYIMEFNLPACKERFAEIAGMAGISGYGMDDAAGELIVRIMELSRILNIPSFRDLGIPEKDFPLIAENAFKNNSNPSNARDMSADDYLDILMQAFNDTGPVP